MKLLYLTFALIIYTANAEVKYFTAHAIGKDGKPAYTEKHSMNFSEERLIDVTTSYFDANNKLFAKLNSNLKKHAFLPDSSFEDLRTNYQEETFLDGQDYVIKINGEVRKRIKVKENMISGQGFDNYLRQQMNQMAVNESKVVSIVIPSRADFYDFSLTRIENDTFTYYFELKITNWFLSLFANQIYVGYNTNKDLTYFNGVSNIKDTDGNNHDVIINLKQVDSLK